MSPIFDVGSLSNEIMPMRRIIMMSEYGFTKTNIISLLNEGSITVADLD